MSTPIMDMPDDKTLVTFEETKFMHPARMLLRNLKAGDFLNGERRLNVENPKDFGDFALFIKKVNENRNAFKYGSEAIGGYTQVSFIIDTKGDVHETRVILYDFKSPSCLKPKKRKPE